MSQGNGQPNGSGKDKAAMHSDPCNGQSPNGDTGALQTTVGHLDMTDPRDRRLLMRRRWKLKPQQMGRYVKALDTALAIAVRNEDAQAIGSILRTATMMEAANQKDEHLAVTLAAKAAGIEDREIVVRYVDEIT